MFVGDVTKIMTNVIEYEVTIINLSHWRKDGGKGKPTHIGIRMQTKDGVQFSIDDAECSDTEFETLQKAYDNNTVLTIKLGIKS